MGSSADFILPVASVLAGPDRLHVGGLLVQNGRVVSLEDPQHGSERGLIAIPGLRNAHAHLDLSLIHGVRRPTNGFGEWVLDLLRTRGPLDPKALQEGAQSGARECLAGGTTSVGDIDSLGVSAAAVAASGLKGVSYREILGAGDGTSVLRELERWVGAFSDLAPGNRTRPGVSPHAPYSTSAGLYQGSVASLETRETGIATHIAETPDEPLFLESGTGPLRDFLDVLKAPLPFEKPPQCGPIEYLRRNGCLGRNTLLVHANYLGHGELEMIQESSSTVVFCPRSHNFFSNGRHPVREMLDVGIAVALGTDSLASNASLSMVSEMAFLRASRPDLMCDEIFRMATGAAARILDGGTGTLVPGEPADVALVEVRGDAPTRLEDALDVITGGAVRVVATLVQGEVCYVHPEREDLLVALTGSGCRLWSSLSEGLPGKTPPETRTSGQEQR